MGRNNTQFNDIKLERNADDFGVNFFWGENKAEILLEKKSLEKFAEKFAANLPKIHQTKSNISSFLCLDGPAIRNANRDDSRESTRTDQFAEHNVRAIRANRTKPAICISLVARDAIRKKGVQSGNPETIRVNQAIRANLQIDSHESGHLSSCGLKAGPCEWVRHMGVLEDQGMSVPPSSR